MDHSYEEIRDVAIDILAGREPVAYGANQYQNLQLGIAEVLARREGGEPAREQHGCAQASLSGPDADTFLEVFWGLFREGIITLGLNDSNPHFPWCRLTHAGRELAQGSHAYWFHDVATYKRVIKENVPEIHEGSLIYLQEAMSAFKAGCFLSATVMVGVAAEHTFELMLEEAERSEPWRTRLQNVSTQRTFLQRVNKFTHVFEQYVREVPTDVREDLDARFGCILSTLRTFRNESGHPTGKFPGREQVYVLLQVFVPYCKKMYDLRAWFRGQSSRAETAESVS